LADFTRLQRLQAALAMSREELAAMVSEMNAELLTLQEEVWVSLNEEIAIFSVSTQPWL